MKSQKCYTCPPKGVEGVAPNRDGEEAPKAGAAWDCPPKPARGTAGISAQLEAGQRMTASKFKNSCCTHRN